MTLLDLDVIARSASDEAIHLSVMRHHGLLRGACQRARIRATRWLAMTASRELNPYRAPNVVAPNSAFCVEGCERQYCGGASTRPPSWAARGQPPRGVEGM